jgi:putative hydrolase of HD superfamily
MKDILKFSKLLEEFQQIERMIYAHAGSKRMEHDSEHSYELAMLAWYLIDTRKLKLDVSKVLRYALLHDIVEVYAGDTYNHSTDIKFVSSKAERERKAAAKLKKNFFEFKEMHRVIHTYEEMKDKESRFVYALDKVVPLIKLYLDGGRRWKELAVSFEMMIENKVPKVAGSPEVKEIFEELVKIIKKDKKKLFYRS